MYLYSAIGHSLFFVGLTTHADQLAMLKGGAGATIADHITTVPPSGSDGGDHEHEILRRAYRRTSKSAGWRNSFARRGLAVRRDEGQAVAAERSTRPLRRTADVEPLRRTAALQQAARHPLD